MSTQLSLNQARSLSLNAQGLTSRSRFGKGLEGCAAAISHLGYVQIDTLSVVARAHSHTLWNRLANFKPESINQLQKEGKIFEHWAHALAYLPMGNYRYSLPMMERIASGTTHWYPKNSKQTKYVLDRIRSEGRLSAKDFTDKNTKKTMWSRSPSKHALEQLFMEGELMIPERVNFHKVYDLRERVLPSYVNTTLPTQQELCRFLVLSFLQAHGIGQLKQFYYLRKGLGAATSQAISDLVDEGLIQEIKIKKLGDEKYYVLKTLMDSIDTVKTNTALRILSPFDNAVIQRSRVLSLFDYDYQIECYVPQAKRKFGYFCLPVLHGSNLVARIDAKADRKTKLFNVMELHIEKPITNIHSFYEKLRKELKRYALFCGCEEVVLKNVKGTKIKPAW